MPESIKSENQSFFSIGYILLSFGLSFAGIALVMYYTYSPDIFEHFQFKRLPGLFVAFIVSIIRVWFSAAKLKYLSDDELNWFASLRIVLAWDFVSAVTPSTVGGAPMALFAMSKENISLGKSTALIIYGVLLDQIWFALAIPFLFIAGFYFDVIPDNAGWVGETLMIAIYIALLVYASLLAYSVLINPKLLQKAVRFVFKIPFLKRYSSKVSITTLELEKSAIELRSKSLKFVFYAFFLSSMSWIARIAIPVIVILSFGPADVILGFLRSFALNLAGLFIPTPGGSGGFEGLFALFLGTIMPRAGFISLAIFMWRLISYYFSIALGAWASMWYIKKK